MYVNIAYYRYFNVIHFIGICGMYVLMNLIQDIDIFCFHKIFFNKVLYDNKLIKQIRYQKLESF